MAEVNERLALAPNLTATEEATVAVQHIVSGPSSTFRFSDLPPELGLRIIEFAVTQEEPVRITILDFDESDEESPDAITEQWKGDDAVANRTQPALTRTCRHIRVDALKLYYTCNEFKGSYCKSPVCFNKLHEWLQGIGAQNRGLLESLMIFDVDFEGTEENQCMEDLWSDSDDELDEDEDGEIDYVGARTKLLALGATIEAAADRGPGVYMVTFPEVEAEE